MARPRGHKASQAAWQDLANLKGFTPTYIAEASQIPRPTISLLAAGTNRASVPVAHKIAEVFGVNPETLFPTLSGNYTEVDRTVGKAA